MAGHGAVFSRCVHKATAKSGSAYWDPATLSCRGSGMPGLHWGRAVDTAELGPRGMFLPGKKGRRPGRRKTAVLCPPGPCRLQNFLMTRGKSRLSLVPFPTCAPRAARKAGKRRPPRSLSFPSAGRSPLACFAVAALRSLNLPERRARRFFSAQKTVQGPLQPPFCFSFKSILFLYDFLKKGLHGAALCAIIS